MATLTTSTVKTSGLSTHAQAYVSPPLSPHTTPLHARKIITPSLGKTRIDSLLNQSTNLNYPDRSSTEKDTLVGTLAGSSQAAGGPGGSAVSGGTHSRSGSISGPAGGNANSGGAGSSGPGHAGAIASSSATVAATKRRDRPCDACRKRKSRCVLNEGQTACVLCQFHSQDCTFVQSPAPRKRRIASTSTARGKDAASVAGQDTEERSSKKR